VKEIEEENIKDGLLSLVVGVLEVVEEVLEREAIRRMGSGKLGEDDIEKLGQSLKDLSEALEGIKEEHGIHREVEDMRGQLDDIVGGDLVEKR